MESMDEFLRNTSTIKNNNNTITNMQVPPTKIYNKWHSHSAFNSYKHKTTVASLCVWYKRITRGKATADHPGTVSLLPPQEQPLAGGFHKAF